MRLPFISIVDSALLINKRAYDFIIRHRFNRRVEKAGLKRSSIEWRGLKYVKLKDVYSLPYTATIVETLKSLIGSTRTQLYY